MAKPKQVIAVFDFDETLIRKDTLLDFMRSNFSLSTFIVNIVRCIPMLIVFGLKLISNQAAKERLLTVFVGNMPVARFNILCESYSHRLDELANPVALACVAWHRQQKHTIVILSASPSNWIKPWAQNHSMLIVIATELEVTDGRLTGKLATPNCYGVEKVNRFLAVYPKRDSYKLYMYGDGKSDQAMFDLADHSFVRTFGNQGLS